MAEFSIQDAAFTGFRVVREHPAALAIWALYALLLSLVFVAIFVGLAGREMTQIMQMGVQPPADPAVVLPLLARIAPAYGLFIIVSIGLYAILGAGMVRAVLQPADDRFGYLRLGADELRQLGLGLLTSLVIVGIYLGLFVVLAVVFAIATAASNQLGVLVLVIGVPAIIAALVIVLVRLSLAPALTFDTQRVNLLGSWALTRGRFWPLFGTYFLTLVLILMVYFLSSLVIFALGAVVSGGEFAAAMAKPELSSLQAYFTPLQIIRNVMMAGVSALVWPVLLTPPAAIYRLLAPAPAVDAFS